MQDENNITDTSPTAVISAEQPRKTWTAPEFERTPLNEALAGSTTASSDATFNLS